MTWFKNRRMAVKLAIAFGVCVALTILVGAEALRSLSTTHERSESLATQARGWVAVKDANIGVLRASRAVRNALLDDNVADIKGRQADIERYRREYSEALAAFEKTLVSEEAKAAVGELRRIEVQLRPAQDELVQLALAGRVDEAKTRLKAARAIADVLDEQVERIEATKARLVDEMTAESQAQYDATTRFTLIVLALAVGVGFAVAFVLTRLITKPLSESVRALNAVAKADFTQIIAADTRDELGDMARALNQASQQMHVAVTDVRTVAAAMAAGDLTAQVRTDLPGALGQMATSLGEAIVKMRTTLDEVRAASETVASAAQQLASASEEISSGAQEQASSLEETAASLEEMTATIKQNADNAQQASQLAGGARGAAENGGQVTTEAVRAMGAISDASKRIADIITAIDEIAFQTNILALNAAVEAARAGEQGRGFAVVATEVRNLAQRSASAAKEIKALIQDSVQKVEAGSDLVNASGRTLNEIVTSVKRVTDIISEIAAASREQSGGIEQVNKAVSQMDQVTQANASQTEEMSGTAESLAGEAGKLQSLIAQFRLGDTAAARIAAPTRRPVSLTPRAKAAPRSVVKTAPAVDGALALDAEFKEF